MPVKDCWGVPLWIRKWWSMPVKDCWSLQSWRRKLSRSRCSSCTSDQAWFVSPRSIDPRSDAERHDLGWGDWTLTLWLFACLLLTHRIPCMIRFVSRKRSNKGMFIGWIMIKPCHLDFDGRNSLSLWSQSIVSQNWVKAQFAVDAWENVCSPVP